MLISHWCFRFFTIQIFYYSVSSILSVYTWTMRRMLEHHCFHCSHWSEIMSRRLPEVAVAEGLDCCTWMRWCSGHSEFLGPAGPAWSAAAPWNPDGHVHAAEGKKGLNVTALSTITNKTKKITIHANLTRTSGSSFGETLYTFCFLSYIFIYEWVFCTHFSCSWLFFFLIYCFHWILSCPFHPWCGYGEFQIFFLTSKVFLMMAFE